MESEQDKMEQVKMVFMNQVIQSLVELEKTSSAPPAEMERFRQWILKK